MSGVAPGVHPDAGKTPILPTNCVSVNGTDAEALERFRIAEICQGWPTHRDACEWAKYRNLFSDDGYVFTTWSKGKTIDDFIEVSIKGFKAGDWIMHRACGITVDLANAGPVAHKRAVGKMKATITQRFKLPSNDGKGTVEVDTECQCRFVFFCFKDPKHNDDWKTKWVKLFYEKDKMIPVDPRKIPHIDDAELAKYPEGYRYLAYCQASLGHPILMGLPERRGGPHDQLYDAANAWLEGKEIDDLLLQ